MKKLRREILLDAILIASNLLGLFVDSPTAWFNLIGVVVLFPRFLRQCQLAADIMEADRFFGSCVADWGDEKRAWLWAACTGAQS